MCEYDIAEEERDALLRAIADGDITVVPFINPVDFCRKNWQDLVAQGLEEEAEVVLNDQDAHAWENILGFFLYKNHNLIQGRGALYGYNSHVPEWMLEAL